MISPRLVQGLDRGASRTRPRPKPSSYLLPAPAEPHPPPTQFLITPEILKLGLSGHLGSWSCREAFPHQTLPAGRFLSSERNDTSHDIFSGNLKNKTQQGIWLTPRKGTGGSRGNLSESSPSPVTRGGGAVTVPQVVREEVASSWGHSSPGWVSRKGLFPRGSF